MALAQTNYFNVLNTLDGQSFTNATITSVTPAYAIVMYDGGGTRVALTNLPSRIQKQYHYDPASASAEMGLIEKKKLALKEAQLAAFKALQESEKDKLFRIVNGEVVSKSKFVSAWGYIYKVLPDGIICGPSQRRSSNSGYQASESQSIGFSYIIPASSTESLPGNKHIFIHCPIAGLAVGQSWGGYCYR